MRSTAQAPRWPPRRSADRCPTRAPISGPPCSRYRWAYPRIAGRRSATIRGLLNRPELTAEKFIADPFSTMEGARLYRTGDLVRYRTDGNIEFLGRIDDQVKVRGFRIELGEIEAALRQQALVREAVVVVREDEPGDKRLVAYIVADGAAADVVESLRAQLRAILPDYMVPSAFVTLEQLPLTPNGKVDRKALPAPGQGRTHLSADYVAPRTPLEAALLTVWTSALKIERIGIHDNFFELGDSSLERC
ncbi:MAG: AMP-binding protein [Uliginosibacterium sp.]|nr:AMP-binding protein [Uliginosibacterium sp.]